MGCFVGGEYNKTTWLYQLSLLSQLATVKSFIADISSVSAIRSGEELTLQTAASEILYSGQLKISTQLITKFLAWLQEMARSHWVKMTSFHALINLVGRINSSDNKSIGFGGVQ